MEIKHWSSKVMENEVLQGLYKIDLAVAFSVNENRVLQNAMQCKNVDFWK